MDRFTGIEAFVRVVETGSFARAASRLGVSTSAVSRQVSELEAHLDVRLLHRTTRRLSLTEAGQSFFEHAVQLLADLEDAEASVRLATTSPRGTLRLTCGVSFGIRYLAPALAEFAAVHPGILYDLDVSDRAVDLVEEGFDLAVRIGTLGHSGMVARRLGWTQIVCCAAPSYLARSGGPPATPADLAQHECLSYSTVGVPNTWHFAAEGGGEPVAVRITPRHRSNNGQQLAALAVHGLGIVFAPDFIVAADIRAGTLVPLLPQHRPPRTAIAAVYPSRRHLSAKVRTLVDFLARRFERDQPWQLDAGGSAASPQ